MVRLLQHKINDYEDIPPSSKKALQKVVSNRPISVAVEARCQEFKFSDLAVMKQNWVCSLQHVYRERDVAADGLAELGHGLKLGMPLFEAPLYSVHHLLLDDDVAAVKSRLIVVP